MMFKKALVFFGVVFAVTSMAQEGTIKCSIANTMLPDDDTYGTDSWDFSPGQAQATLLKKIVRQVGDLQVSMRVLNVGGEPSISILVLDTKMALDKKSPLSEQEQRTVLRKSEDFSSGVVRAEFKKPEVQEFYIECTFNQKSAANQTERKSKAQEIINVTQGVAPILRFAELPHGPTDSTNLER